MNEQERKVAGRPILISIVCILLFIIYGLQLIAPLLWIESKGGFRKILFDLFVVFKVGFVNSILPIIAIYGLWKMKKWGLYLYSIIFLFFCVNVLLGKSHIICFGISNILTFFESLFLLSTPIIIGGFYFKKLK